MPNDAKRIINYLTSNIIYTSNILRAHITTTTKKKVFWIKNNLLYLYKFFCCVKGGCSYSVQCLYRRWTFIAFPYHRHTRKISKATHLLTYRRSLSSNPTDSMIIKVRRITLCLYLVIHLSLSIV